MTISITLPARAQAQLTAEDVRVVRGGRTVLDGVNLSVSPQARWGVVGENGRGKTTLLHVLSGALVPDEGDVQQVGTLGIAEQAMAAGPDATVGGAVDMELADARAALKAFDDATQGLAEGRPGAEQDYATALDAAEALDAWDADRRVDLALENLGAVTDRGRRLSELSVGQRYRVRLACLLGAEHDFLLLDEPTNHLDAAGLEFLTARLRALTGWRPDKGTGKHQRATRAPGVVRAVHRRRDDLEKHAVTAPVPPQRFKMPDLPARPGVSLLSADDVRVESRLHQEVSLSLESGSRLVVTGPNGTGKSTLLAVLAGHLAPTSGTTRRAPNTRVQLLAQESPHADGRRAHDVFSAHAGRLITTGVLGEDEAVSLSALGLLSSADLGRPVGELSMGQQRRLDLATALAARPHVLLLDEPTNHLSIALVDELTDALHATPAAVVLATHDRQLQRDTATWPRLDL